MPIVSSFGLGSAPAARILRLVGQTGKGRQFVPPLLGVLPPEATELSADVGGRLVRDGLALLLGNIDSPRTYLQARGAMAIEASARAGRLPRWSWCRHASAGVHMRSARSRRSNSSVTPAARSQLVAMVLGRPGHAVDCSPVRLTWLGVEHDWAAPARDAAEAPMGSVDQNAARTRSTGHERRGMAIVLPMVKGRRTWV